MSDSPKRMWYIYNMGTSYWENWWLCKNSRTIINQDIWRPCFFQCPSLARCLFHHQFIGDVHLLGASDSFGRFFVGRRAKGGSKHAIYLQFRLSTGEKHWCELPGCKGELHWSIVICERTVGQHTAEISIMGSEFQLSQRRRTQQPLWP